MLVLPDHPTPIKVQTHTGDPVPFLLWGEGFSLTGQKDLPKLKLKALVFLLRMGIIL